MAIPIWRTTIKNKLDLDKTWYSGIFEVTDYESQHKL